jgi:hypothetical protein
MRTLLSVLAAAVASVAIVAFAQDHAPTALLESPIRIEPHAGVVSETVFCTLPLGGGTASMYGCDDVTYGVHPTEFVSNELHEPFRVFHFDEFCNLLGTWETAFPGPTSTGIAFDRGTGSTYWNVDPSATGSILEFELFTGVPTGRTLPLPWSGTWGCAAFLNWFWPPESLFVGEIAADLFVEIDVASGAVGCTFPNPDNSGSGAYGNGLSDTQQWYLAVASGRVDEGQASRVSWTGCDGIQSYDVYDLVTPLAPYGENFPNDISQFWTGYFRRSGNTRLMVVGNATGTIYNLGYPAPTTNCHGIDSPDSDVLWMNASQGSADILCVDPRRPLGGAIQKPPAGGSGRYVVHVNEGFPTTATVTELPAGLGVACFPFFSPPFGDADPVAVFNNLGKTDRIGASAYFGIPAADPPPAPSFFLARAQGDPVNLPLDTYWTMQGIVANPAASSRKQASVTNVIVLHMRESD